MSSEHDLLKQLHQSQESVERLLLIQQEYMLRNQQMQHEKQALSFTVSAQEQRLASLQQQCRKQAELNISLLKKLSEHLQSSIPASIPDTLRADYLLLLASGYFEPDTYLDNNPDVKAAGIDPLLHFLESGGAEGRSCGSKFDNAAYLKAYNDVAIAGVNPLVHYLRYGMPEGRTDQP